MTFGVESVDAIDVPAMREKLAIAGGIKDQKEGSADYVSMKVKADTQTVVRVRLSSADDKRLYKVKRLMMASFDSIEEADGFFDSVEEAAKKNGAPGHNIVARGAPFFFGLTPPPPPPPTLSIVLRVKNADALSDEMMSELTGTLAETLSRRRRQLSSTAIIGNDDGTLTAEKTGDTEITVRITGVGLDLHEVYQTLQPLMDKLGKINSLLNGCPPDDCQTTCLQFACSKADPPFPFHPPVFSGLTHPPPSPPPPLPPLEPRATSGRETVAGVEEEGEESSGSSLGTILLVLGIIFFLVAACIAVYLVKSKVPFHPDPDPNPNPDPKPKPNPDPDPDPDPDPRSNPNPYPNQMHSDKAIAEGRVKPFAWFWSQAREDADVAEETGDMEEADRRELEMGLPREQWPVGMEGSLNKGLRPDDGFGARPESFCATSAAAQQPAATYPPTSPGKERRASASYAVELKKTPLGFGITVDDDGTVTEIQPDSQAARSGQIKLGDRLAAVNGKG